MRYKYIELFRNILEHGFTMHVREDDPETCKTIFMFGHPALKEPFKFFVKSIDLDPVHGKPWRLEKEAMIELVKYASSQNVILELK